MQRGIGMIQKEEFLRQQNRDKECIISILVNDNQEVEQPTRKYLEGKESIEACCALHEKIGHKKFYGIKEFIRTLNDYSELYQDSDFYRKCIVYLMLLRGTSWQFFSERIRKNVTFLRQIFSDCDQENMTLECQLKGAVMIVEYSTMDRKEAFYHKVKPIFAAYLQKDRVNMAKAFANANMDGRYLGLMTYEMDAETYKEEILGFSKETSKVVKEKVKAILCEHENWSEDIKRLLRSSKIVERTLAIDILQVWDKPTDKEDLKKALEQEKSVKIRAQLLGILGEEALQACTHSEQDLVERIVKGGKKRMVAWAYETPFMTVHKKDGTLADETYLQALLICYAAMEPCGMNRDAAGLAKQLDTLELVIYVNALYDKWIADGAQIKRKWVLYAASIHGGMQAITNLQRNIAEWPTQGRGNLAVEAMYALALSPQPQALLIVEGMARKAKSRQIRREVTQVLDFAAKQFGLNQTQFEDKIVPTLGFDKNGQRIFDYGSRIFCVTLLPSLSLEIATQDGKSIKSMPKPGKQEDTPKAWEAYQEFKQMKIQLKTVISRQKERLERMLASAWRWDRAKWCALFVQNPVMHLFALGLVWGVYEKESLQQSFRYMEDGSFNTAQEEIYHIPEEAQIGLVHPIELSDKERIAWIQQFEDYEIKQPLVQLQRGVYQITKEEREKETLDRFGGYVVNVHILSGIMQRLGWSRGLSSREEDYWAYYREDGNVGLRAQLRLLSNRAALVDQEVTLSEVCFFQTDSDVTKEELLLLKEVPIRYFSEIVWQLEEVVRTSKERRDDWKMLRE